MWMHTIPDVTLQVLRGDPERGPAMESTCLITHQSQPEKARPLGSYAGTSRDVQLPLKN